MSASGWSHIDVDLIEEETQSAFLLVQGDKKFWVPKSQVSRPKDYKEGDKDCCISVREWFAEKHGIS